MKILLAEDNQKLLKTLTHILKSDGYVVDGVDNGDDALDYALSDEYDGLVLDIMMPGQDGITVLKQLRKKGIGTPALFLTARTEVDQRVEGLDAGADDYLPKPFETKELLARIRAMLRRKDSFTPDLVTYKGLTLNRSNFILQYKDKSVSLSGREFNIMEMLMLRADSVVSTEQLMTHIWGWESESDTSVVWVHISNLRKKLESLSCDVQIKFKRMAGYVLEGKNDL